MQCTSSAGSSASAASCRCRCERSRPRRTPTPRLSRRHSAGTPTSSTASTSSSRPRSPIRASPGSSARSSRTPECGRRSATLPAAGADGHHGYAGGLLEHTVGVATLCRETAQLHPRLRDDLLLAAALLHDLGRIRELGPGPSFRQTEEGRLLGHVHLGLRVVEERGRDLDPAVLSELLHAIGCHHDRSAAKTAEAAVLYHANQLDAQAATRPVGDD